MDSTLRRKIERFQKSQLAKLATLSADELRKLPKSQALDPPASLRGERFSITRERIAKGTYEISVRYHLPPNPQLSAEIEADMSALGFPGMKIGERTSSQWFCLGPGGKITWPQHVHDPDD
jgi:hypothetical protein